MLLSSELHFLTPICTKSFVGWGFTSDPVVKLLSKRWFSSIQGTLFG